jgi:hypothetical protein
MARPHQSHLEKLRRLPLRPSLRFRCGLRVRSSSRFFALATPVGQGVTAAVAAERLAGFLCPIKGGPSQGRHRPLGTAHPHAMANARQAVRPVISRSTPVATSLTARSSPVRAETPSRRASRRPVISGSRSATAPAAAARNGRFPEARRSGGPPPAADRVRGRRAVLPRRRSRDRSARNPLPLAASALIRDPTSLFHTYPQASRLPARVIRVHKGLGRLMTGGPV